MIRTSTRIAFEVVLGVIAVAALLVGVAFWRLSSGPVDLDFMTGRVERALSDPQGGYTVQIGATVLSLGERSRTVDLHARDVRVRDAAGTVIAALPDTVVRVSVRALVQGTIAASAVEVFGASLRIVRQQNGTFQFGSGPAPDAAEVPADEAPDLSAVFPAVIRRLLSRPQPGEPLSYLRRVSILGGRLFVEDRRVGRSWRAPYADIKVWRNTGGLAGRLDLTVARGGSEAAIAGNFQYDGARRLSDVRLTFDGVRPESIIWFAPGLTGLAGLTTPLSGSVSGTVALDGAIHRARFDITGAKGRLSLPELGRPWPVRSLGIAGEVDGAQRKIDVKHVRLELGAEDESGPRIEASGTLTGKTPGFGGDLDLSAEVAASDISVSDLEGYWLPSLGGNARDWVVANITSGRIERVRARANLVIPGGRLAEARLNALEGDMAYRDLAVHYLRPMPPVEKVTGTATFDASRMVFAAQGGGLGDLRVEPSVITITGLDGADQDMTIDLAMRGPLRDALNLLDHDRLALIRRLEIDPGTTEGEFAARVELGFPLVKDLDLERISISASANLRHAGVKKLFLGRDASDGDLALKLDKSGMTLTGPLRLAGVPFDVNWVEAFSGEMPVRTQIDIKAARFDAKERAAFGIATEPYLNGPVSAHITAMRAMGGRTTIKAAINLQEAALEIAPLSWKKGRGETGAAYFTLILEGGRLRDLKDLDINAGTLRARGEGRFRPDGMGLESLSLGELGFNGTSLRDVTIALDGEELSISAGGGNLDATPWLTASGDVRETGKETEHASRIETAPSFEGAAGPALQPQSPDEPASPAYRPLKLRARGLNAVYFGADRYFRDVDLEVERGAYGWTHVSFYGRVPRALWHVPGNKGRKREAADDSPAVVSPGESGTSVANPAASPQTPANTPDATDVTPPASLPVEIPATESPRTLKVEFGPSPNGERVLKVTAQDMGAVLRALDIMDTIEGGRLLIQGRSDGPLPTGTLKVRIRAKDYVVLEAPLLAKLLTVASLSGINDLMRGEGIRFRRLVGEVTVGRGKLYTDLLRAYGPALGLTAKGEVDLDLMTAQVRGTVVPAYTLNRVLGKIPLLGPLLTGGEGEGFLAITYRIDGPLADPKIVVNPLSALAPGFLRNLIGGEGGDADDNGALDADGNPAAPAGQRAEP